MKITVEQEISEEALDNVLCCALDPGYGGAYYWCEARRDPANPAREAEYLHEVILKGGTILIHDKEEGKRYKIDRASLEQGLKAMALGDDPCGPRTLANIIADNTDADDGDALIQFCVFGKTIYG